MDASSRETDIEVLTWGQRGMDITPFCHHFYNGVNFNRIIKYS